MISYLKCSLFCICLFLFSCSKSIDDEESVCPCQKKQLEPYPSMQEGKKEDVCFYDQQVEKEG